MFAKPSWFQKRKYGGWGIHPRTWQGWLYIFFFIFIMIAFQSIPFWDEFTRIMFTLGWALILGFDTLRIMITLKKDELEERNEAIAERNASWTMVLVITIGIVYQIIQSGLNQSLEFDPFLAIALIAGVVVKGISYFRLEKK